MKIGPWVIIMPRYILCHRSGVQVACSVSASHIISDSIIPWKHIDWRKTCRQTTTKFQKMFQVISALGQDDRWFRVGIDFAEKFHTV